MNPVTIKDIAKAAGVSPATVSCCLTGTRNVKPETKNRIMRIIEQMRYIPNSSARNLRIHSSERIKSSYAQEFILSLHDIIQNISASNNEFLL